VIAGFGGIVINLPAITGTTKKLTLHNFLGRRQACPSNMAFEKKLTDGRPVF